MQSDSKVKTDIRTGGVVNWNLSLLWELLILIFTIVNIFKFIIAREAPTPQFWSIFIALISTKPLLTKARDISLGGRMFILVIVWMVASYFNNY